jgi:predicted O-linked N-acetylglucosamine transferase (SPINDLY family)
MSAVAASTPPPAGDGHWREGVDLAANQRWPEAVRAFARATRAAPSDRVYWLNLANAQRRAGALTRSVAASRRCLQLAPADPIALRLLAQCLSGMHRHAEAATAYAALEEAEESDAATMVQHAQSLLALQQPGAAAAVLLRALSLEPGLVPAHLLLADACRDQGLKREAVECMRTVLAIEPGNIQALSNLSYEKRHLCDWSDYEQDLEQLREDMLCAPQGLARVMAVFSLLSLPLDPQLVLASARGEALSASAGVRPLPPPDPAQRRPGRLRIGWVSYDFRDHPVAQLLQEVLAAIDRERFEVVLYSIGPGDASVWRARLKATADRFVDLRNVADDRAAELIRADGIDVLIDLMGHTRGRRMTIFAYRPAPVQASFLGFPGSTGAEFIDYLIGDPLVTPLVAAPQYSEKLAQMPLTFQPNGRGRPLPQPMTRAQAGLPEDAFVMCAFNNPYKILPETFDLWCGLMRELPHAVLWLRETNGQLHHNVLAEAARRGIAAERILFAKAVPYGEHFSRLALADVFVDTWPYNAHTTAADALWAGVPVVTRYGNSFASRVAASVLNAVGLGELAFASAEEYRHAVLVLAREPEMLAGYRRHLSEQRLQLPLFDTPRYALELQALLERMAGRWQQGQSPAHLPAAGAE